MRLDVWLFIIFLLLYFLELTKKLDNDTFAAKLGLISTKCLCKLLNDAPHFNFANNIIKCLVQLTCSSNSKVFLN